ncbi:MAG: succinylglutamate desuccinylase/aspartoacylase family protein [bacterium]
MQRIIGEYDNHLPGPIFVCIGGMHGNEPAGVIALQRVLAKLKAERPSIRGKFIALRGNLQGLSTKQRYIDKDLNRMWLPERMKALENGSATTSTTVEENEQIELYHKVHEILDTAQDRIVVLDLHTTSSASKPFAIFGDTIRNRNFAEYLRTPLILGLEEAIAGTLIEHITNLGHIAIAFEAGQHDAEEAVDIHEAAVWLALEAAGNISRNDIRFYRSYVDRITADANGLPGVLEITYRHAIRPDDTFQMEPGYVNFQRVRGGQLLARDKNGGVWSPKNYHIFMPLYQGLGDDGFFLARPINPIWLSISKSMRQLHLDTFMHYFPGVEKHPAIEHAFRVNTRIARWLVMEIFHLLGYRRERKENGVVVVSKRKYDLTAPPIQMKENGKAARQRQLIQ